MQRSVSEYTTSSVALYRYALQVRLNGQQSVEVRRGAGGVYFARTCHLLEDCCAVIVVRACIRNAYALGGDAASKGNELLYLSPECSQS